MRFPKRIIKFSLFVWVLCSISIPIYSQNRVIDSLKLRLTKASTELKKVKIHIELSKIYTSIGQYNEGIKQSGIAREIAIKNNFQEELAKSYCEIGVANESKGNYTEALKNYFLCYKTDFRLNDSLISAIALNNIGNIYLAKNNCDKALHFYTKALCIFKKLKNEHKTAIILFNIGDVYEHQGIYDKALVRYLEVLKINEKIKDDEGFAYMHYRIGGILFLMNQYEVAINHYKQSLHYSLKIQDKHSECSSYIGLSKVYISQNNSRKAIFYGLEAIDLAKTLENHDFISESYICLFKTDSMQSHYQQAIKNYQLYIAYCDSIKNNKLSEEMLQIQMQYEFDQQQEIKKQEQLRKEERQKIELERQILIRNIIIGGFLLLLLFSIYLFWNYKQKQKINTELQLQQHQIKARNRTLDLQTKKQTTQRDLIQQQKQLLEEKQKEVLDSIHYAQRIQQALLTSENYIKKLVPDFFILYHPKDIVSGDFYWATQSNDQSKFIIATADCTGHGVPGAFMSMLGVNFLNEIIVKRNYTRPDTVLNKLRDDIIKTLNPEEQEQIQQEGMDCVLCAFDFKNLTLEYAAANNSFYIVRNGELLEFKADKMPVGLYSIDMKPFMLNTIQLEKGDCVYTFTDGYADQFGGPKGKKFKYKQFEELLLANAHLSMNEQKQLLQQRFNEWKGKNEQVDDVLVIGIQI